MKCTYCPKGETKLILSLSKNKVEQTIRRLQTMFSGRWLEKKVRASLQ